MIANKGLQNYIFAVLLYNFLTIFSEKMWSQLFVYSFQLCNMAALISWDDDEGDLKQTTPTPTRNQKPISAATNKTTNNSSGNNKPKSPHQSSRIRYGFLKIHFFFKKQIFRWNIFKENSTNNSICSKGPRLWK